MSKVGKPKAWVQASRPAQQAGAARRVHAGARLAPGLSGPEECVNASAVVIQCITFSQGARGATPVLGPP